MRRTITEENLKSDEKKFSLEINQDKSKYIMMRQTQKLSTIGGTLTHVPNDGRRNVFKRVKKFCYLEVAIEEKWQEKQEIKARIAKGSRKPQSIGEVQIYVCQERQKSKSMQRS